MDTNNKQKTSMLIGCTGQDGSYLAELLLSKGYKVIGVKRRSSTNNLWRLKDILDNPNFEIVEGDITDAISVYNLVDKYKPDELYNLAAQSHVHTSFEQPQYTAMVDYIGVVNILEAVRKLSPKTKIYQAGTSEEFGSNVDENGFQNEDTEFKPQSPYAISKVAAHQMCKLYRQAYGLFICVGVLFNHESPRRGEEFVTRKITKWIGDNYNKLKEKDSSLANKNKLNLGNLDASRDWGHARDFVYAMYLMLQQDNPDDYVVATGETHTIREFLDVAFKVVDVDNWEPFVYINPEFVRPAEVQYLRGDYKKAKDKLGWKPQISFEALVSEMVNSDAGNQSPYSYMLQSVNMNPDLTREELFELGNKIDIDKWINYPIEISEINQAFKDHPIKPYPMAAIDKTKKSP